MTASRDFPEVYETTLLPELRQIEQERVKVKGLATIACIVIGASVLVGSTVFAIVTDLAWWEIVFPAIAMVFVTLMWMVKATDWIAANYTLAFKRRIIRRLVQFIDARYTYTPHGYVRQSSFKKSGLFRSRVDRYRGNDLVKGQIGSLRFQFSELHVETYGGNRDDETLMTVFQGLFFEVTLPASTTGETYVLPDPSARKPTLDPSRRLDPETAPVTRVTLDDPAFARYFKVFSTQPKEAPGVLLPRTRQWLVDLQLKTELGISAAFVADRLYLAIPYLLPQFEPEVFASMLESRALDGYLDKLLLANGIAEALALDLSEAASTPAPP